MAYKSKVTNKYYGSTYEGRPRVAESSPLADLHNAINRNIKSFEAAGANYIQGKKEDAVAEMMKLRNEGKSTEEITKIILSGENAILSNMYAESAVQGQNGRFAAADAIAQIKKAVAAGEYDYTSMNLTEFHKKFIQGDGANIKGYDLNNQDDSFVLGFSAVFQEWQTEEKIKDAELKGAWHNNQKIQKVITLLEAVPKVEDIMGTLKATSIELPKLDGKGKRQFFLTGAEQNTVLLSYATKLYNTAETVEDLEKAIAILELNRGKGTGGNELGSLLDTDPKAQDLNKKIDDRITAMENQNYTEVQRAIKKEKEDGLVDIFSEKDLGQRQVLITAMIDKYPEMATTINSITTNLNDITEDKGAVEKLKERILDGEFADKDADFMMSQILQHTNSWSTISQLIGLNQDIERGINAGYGNPVLDSQVVDLHTKLQKIMVDLVPEDSYGGDADQINQVAFDLVEMDINAEYRQWYAKNPKPLPTDDIKDQEKWLQKQEKWLNDKYAEKVALYTSDAFKSAIDQKLTDDFRLTDVDSLDLDTIPKKWADSQIKETSELFKGEEIDEIVAIANRELRPIMQVLQENPRFKKLMAMEGFNKIFTENDTNLVAETILKQLGITDEDFSEQRKQIEDNIRLNSTLLNLGAVGDVQIKSWADMQNLMENNWGDNVGKGDVEKFRELVITNLESILNMQPNFNLIAGLSTEAQENLATMFGISPNEFDQLLEFVFPN